MDFPSLEGHTLMKFKHFAAEDIGTVSRERKHSGSSKQSKIDAESNVVLISLVWLHEAKKRDAKPRLADTPSRHPLFCAGCVL